MKKPKGISLRALQYDKGTQVLMASKLNQTNDKYEKSYSVKFRRRNPSMYLKKGPYFQDVNG